MVGALAAGLVMAALGSEAAASSDDRITIHLVPHSHDDVGWQNTIDGYFYREPSAGTSFTGMMGSVNAIISGVIDSLLDNPIRKFSWVEQKYFTMWWHKQSEVKKNQVRYLVMQKQLVFVNGGWVANDEACPNYQDILTNYIVG